MSFHGSLVAPRHTPTFGLDRVRQEPIVPVREDGVTIWSGRGWSHSRLSAHLLKPRYATLIAAPVPFSGSTNGRIRGEPILVPIPPLPETEFQKFAERFRDKLRGRILVFGEEPKPIA